MDQQEAAYESWLQESYLRERRTTDKFCAYFSTINTLFEIRTNEAEQCAENLLDRGMQLTKIGWTFLLFSILVWQLLTYKAGFQIQFAYGIASCSILFIFIEFLSAWFFRQYKFHVCAAANLVRLKAIFDRYMLVYLVLAPNSRSSIQTPANDQLAAILSAELRWPDQGHSDYGVNFAKDAIAAIQSLLRTLAERKAT